MVTVTNGIETFRVTAGAVKPLENMGFHVVSDEEQKEMNHAQAHMSLQDVYDSTYVEDASDEDASDEDVPDEGEEDDVSAEEAVFIEELLEKPLSQWSSAEIKEFVRIKNIDTSGAQKVSQVRAIVKEYLEEEQKKNNS